MIILYHGSNQSVETPKILESKRALDFGVKNRTKMPLAEKYDLIIGPVANDSTLPVINDYIDGKYTKEEAINHLLPPNLKDQFAFVTEQALKYLRFTGVKEI
ncbi:MAG: DUF3990 domain-containing protein [Treponema sp.]